MPVRLVLLNLVTTVAVATNPFAFNAVLGDAGSIRNVGHLGGGLTLAASALNDKGVSVGQSVTLNGNFRGYVSYPDGSIIEVGTLGGFDSHARGINEAGVIVGESGTLPNNQYHAFRQDGTAPLRDLGTLGGSNSFAWAVNGEGLVVGYSSTGQGSGLYHAFRQIKNGSMQDLVTGDFGERSLALGVNDRGVIVGGATVPSGTFHVFRYTGNGPMEDLGLLANSYGSMARAVNERGEIAGYAMMHPSAIDETHAIRRRLNGAIVDLGTLGGDTSEANAIHDSGVIVGSATLANQHDRAALWRTDDSIANLDAWLDLVNPAEGAKWLLTDAFDINSHGQVCGRGFYDDGPGGLTDGQTGFVLDAGSFIPEPGAAGAILAMAAATRRRRADESTVSRPRCGRKRAGPLCHRGCN